MIFKLGQNVDRSKCLWGIDASAWQPKIDWVRLHDGGCRFAILKALEGVLSVDKKFREHLRGFLEYMDWCAQRHTMPMRIGLYAFVHPDADYLDARDEANGLCAAFEQVCQGIESAQKRSAFAKAWFTREALVLPCSFDLEVWPPKIKGRELREWIGEWYRIVEKRTRMAAMNYTNLSYGQAVGIDDMLRDRPLWIADYDRSIDATTTLEPSVWKRPHPRAPKGYNAWHFWQPDAHKIDGVTNESGQHVRCDINFFNGNEDDLSNFVKLFTYDGV